jgi:hypothetical protein
MNLALENPGSAPRRPEEHAMRVAKLAVGEPKPRAEQRYVVEAFWVTLRIQFLMASLAQVWMDDVKGNRSYHIDQRRLWATFVLFLLGSCSRDAEMAFQIAKSSESRKQMTTTATLIMRAELERFRFNVAMTKHAGTFAKDHKELSDKAASHGRKAEEYMQSTIAEHRRVLRTQEADEWLDANFTLRANIILGEWGKLERTLRMDTVYEPVSLEEKEAIVRSFGFSKSRYVFSSRIPLKRRYDSTYRAFLQLPQWAHLCDCRCE